MPERSGRLDSMMKVCVYTPLNRLAIPSGVPRHIREMVSGLLHDESLDLEFFVNRAEALKYLPSQPQAWQAARTTLFEEPTSRVARRWGLLNRPSFESLGGSADWLYLPADGYVPTEKAKLAVTVHDVYKLESPAPGENKSGHYYARLRHKIIYSRVAKQADRILTVSQFSADRIMHHLKVPASRIEIVSNGVSASFFKPRQEVWERLAVELQLEPGRFVVHSGGLKAKKNGAGVVAAWSEVERRHPSYRLVILGHHDPKILQRAQQTLRTAIYPEGVSDEGIAALLQQSAALFFPSFYEGFGMPVLEAMAAGTLAVISDIPALREIAGDLAFYVDPRDPAAMACGLDAALHANDERSDRIEAGRRHAAGFTWSGCVGRLRAALN
jgi:glycosyltransferase involved in cell wall biosynthesis